jgi:cytochrome oxidase Cu insertion factor (SCO1/SenC/PrrC family)
MKESALPYWLTFAVFLAALYGGFKWYQVEQWRTQGSAVVANNLPPLTDFELTERSGKAFRSADMKGKVWVASFFFATCPGSCTRLNSNIKQLTMLDDIREVTWVSITVDPENDTLDVLREYADRFGADPQRWLFCRGEFGYVKRLADNVLKVGGVSYKSHNDYAVVVDKNGRVAGMFNATSTTDSEKGVELLKQLLSERPAEPSHAVANSQHAEAA